MRSAKVPSQSWAIHFWSCKIHSVWISESPYLCQKNLLNSHPPLLKKVLKVRKIQPEIRRLIGESFILKTFKKLMLDVEWLIYKLVMNTHQDFTPLKWTRYIYIFLIFLTETIKKKTPHDSFFWLFIDDPTHPLEVQETPSNLPGHYLWRFLATSLDPLDPLQHLRSRHNVSRSQWWTWKGCYICVIDLHRLFLAH